MTEERPDAAADPEAVRARLTERLSRIRGELDTLRSAVDRSLARGDAGRSGGGSAVWARSARRLDGAVDQVGALNRLLEECLLHASRAVLFVAKDGGLVAWRSAGFLSPPERSRDRPASCIAGEPVARVLDGFPLALPPGNEVSVLLEDREMPDGVDPVRAVLVPFVVREKVAGALYADAPAAPGGRPDPDAIALLAYLAGLVVDRLSNRELSPSPPLRPIETVGGAPANAGGNGRSLAGPLAPDGPEERREAARKFARLLASEIKLYNEPAVLEGVERGNVYARLSDVIDRGRRLYEERVPADVRSAHDHYYEELVDVLAGGRSEVLGIPPRG